MNLTEFIHALPKAELHLHLEGAVPTATVLDLARKHGIAAPDFADDPKLCDFEDLAAFLRVYDIICRSIRTPDDFRRVTYETLQRCASSNVRYVELFFSPQAHRECALPYGRMLDGIIAGMKDAQQDLAIEARLIPAHNRELGPAAGMDFLDTVLADRRDEVIGIGLDYLEAGFPPGPYAGVYAAAKKAGLRATAHAGESGPASNIRDALDLLACDRIDHGYHVVDDAGLVEECRRSGITFTVCPSTTAYTTIWRDLDATDHPIRRMADAGLNIAINTDDPGLFRTDLDTEFRIVAERMHFDAARLARCALQGLDGSWLDAGTKARRKADWAQQMQQLLAAVDP